MKKETLRIENIKKDLSQVLWRQISNKEEWRLSYITPITALAILLGFLLRSVWIGILVFSCSLYHIYYYVIELKEHRKNKRALTEILDRGDVSISVEKLSHISEEIIYEPHAGRRGSHSMTKIVTVYHFEACTSWRVPNLFKHYSWSKEFYLSPKGLENISLVGDEFFYICVKGNRDVAYIYPCKLFELDESLQIKD